MYLRSSMLAYVLHSYGRGHYSNNGLAQGRRTVDRIGSLYTGAAPGKQGSRWVLSNVDDFMQPY